MTKKFFVSLLFIALFVSVSSAAGRYMMCTGTNVRVRATPSTSGRIITQIGNGAILVVEEKNTGEKFPWYKVLVGDDGYNETVPGWVYGQFLRKMKTRDDYSLASVNGIAWGTPYSEISGLSKLVDKTESKAPYPSACDGEWVYKAYRKETYKEGDITIPNAMASYVFDAQKRLVGFSLCAEAKPKNKTIRKIYEKLLEKLGESEDVGKDWMDGADTMLYNFKDFNVEFGTAYDGGTGTYYLYYYVVKKSI